MSGLRLSIVLFILVVWNPGNRALTFNCTNDKEPVNIFLDQGEVGGFITVPSCSHVTSSNRSLFVLTNCIKFQNFFSGFLILPNDTTATVMEFSIDCKNTSRVVHPTTNTAYVPIRQQHPVFASQIILGGDHNGNFYLGQKIPITLTAPAPYMIAPENCTATSSANPNDTIVLSEHGVTRYPSFLTNFSSKCNSTLTATMFGFRFVRSDSVILHCFVRSCTQTQSPSGQRDVGDYRGYEGKMNQSMLLTFILTFL